MSCHGPCNQGRLPCPTPDRCRDGDDLVERYGLLLVVALIGLVALLMGVEFWR